MNAAARSSSSIGSKETTKAGGPSPAHIASASRSCSERHSTGAPTVKADGAWAAPADAGGPSPAHIASTSGSGSERYSAGAPEADPDVTWAASADRRCSRWRHPFPP
jgi:hypothetical protein